MPEFVETQHFFLDLPALADALKEWLDEREASGTWRPNVIKFSQNILEDIRPRAMTRDIDWGIPVPVDGWEDQPDQAALRLVRRGHRLPLRVRSSGPAASASRTAGASGGTTPEALSYYFMGKDNITFHSQIWPAELLAYDGRGDRGGEPGEYGALNLPTEVVSSEFLTMEGKQFSSSRGVVIYVRDVLERYQPDALRYFISAAGPENQDSNFTWAEFVRRTNDELVAGWGNLVNRTATMIAKSFGEIPPPATLEPTTTGRCSTPSRRRSATVGALIGRHRQKAALAEAMRTVAEVNKYVSDSAPWKLKGDDERDRLGTILHVTAQAVADCNLLLAPFLPHSANAVDRGARRRRDVAPMPEIREVEDLDGGPAYPILTGEYSGFPAWERRPVVAGHAGRQAGAGVHQARPVGGRRGAGPARRRPGMTLHPQAVAALELWAQGPSVADPGFGPTDIAAMRRDALAAAALEEQEPVDRVEDVDADGVPCRLYVPDRRPRPARAVLFLHGGGFVFGDVDTHDGQARRLANRTGSAVLAVDYRRPPEHRFPAAPDDVDTALRWLLAHADAPRPRPGPGGRRRRQRRRQPRAGRGAAQPQRCSPRPCSSTRSSTRRRRCRPTPHRTAG